MFFTKYKIHLSKIYQFFINYTVHFKNYIQLFKKNLKNFTNCSAKNKNYTVN